MTSPRPISLDRLDRMTPGPSGQDALFAYGTLQFPEILLALLGRVPEHGPGAVTGWRAAALPGRVYPGLVPAAGTASGLLLTGLTAVEWRVIDDYENDRYELERLALTDRHRAWAYVYDHEAGILPHDWSAREFADSSLAAFAQRCRDWRSQHADGGQPRFPSR